MSPLNNPSNITIAPVDMAGGTTLSTSGAWTSVDLSGVVGSAAKFVTGWIKFVTAGQKVQLRASGDTGNPGGPTSTTTTQQIGVIVPLGSDLKFEYYLTGSGTSPALYYSQEWDIS